MSLKAAKTSAIGIMSGTSLDGLDLCYAEFVYDDIWGFKILETKFIPYDDKWRSSLSNAHGLLQEDLDRLHFDFGDFTASCVNEFLKNSKHPKPDLICSHGHTVFHDPANGVTLQIGDGKTIARETGITCISDFRSEDVALGGQGAPLVPIGDELLFSNYEACLNLGGFSNISFREENERKAFDICPVNITLNPLANLLGKEYDRNGEIARSGSVNQELLDNLNALSLYTTSLRPSLAREWLESDVQPIIESSSAPTQDKITTVTEHAAHQIALVINSKAQNGRVLVTGGGAKNEFLVERLRKLSNSEIVVPELEIVDFKEALIFGFLGVLKHHGQVNVLRSVTGAARNSSSGKINIVS